jgi:hypothetical protein
MKSVCKNCNYTFESQYCGQCGQDSHTHQINAHFLWHDIQHGFLHFDKGILFTLKELFTRPGFSIKEYLNGKRVKHFKPVSLIIILAGIWGLLYHYMPVSIQENVNEKATTGVKVIHWLRDHSSIAELINLPFYALASYLVFKTYNYWEHVVINAFLIAQKTVLSIVFLPILFSLKDSGAQIIVSGFISVISFVLLFWGYGQIFDFYSKVKVLFLTLLVYLILVAETLLISFVFAHI